MPREKHDNFYCFLQKNFYRISAVKFLSSGQEQLTCVKKKFAVSCQLS